MGNLKLTSIRVSTGALDSAHALAVHSYYYNPSDVLRLAMWVGLKIITPANQSELFRKMWEEEAGPDIIVLEDVLHTAGVIKDECER